MKRTSKYLDGKSVLNWRRGTSHGSRARRTREAWRGWMSLHFALCMNRIRPLTLSLVSSPCRACLCPVSLRGMRSQRTTIAVWVLATINPRSATHSLHY